MRLHQACRCVWLVTFDEVPAGGVCTHARVMYRAGTHRANAHVSRHAGAFDLLIFSFVLAENARALQDTDFVFLR